LRHQEAAKRAEGLPDIKMERKPEKQTNDTKPIKRTPINPQFWFPQLWLSKNRTFQKSGFPPN
jgi:hypothetical protein